MKQGNMKKYIERGNRWEFLLQHTHCSTYSYRGNNGLEINGGISRDFLHLFNYLVANDLFNEARKSEGSERWDVLVRSTSDAQVQRQSWVTIGSISQMQLRSSALTANCSTAALMNMIFRVNNSSTLCPNILPHSHLPFYSTSHTDRSC